MKQTPVKKSRIAHIQTVVRGARSNRQTLKPPVPKTSAFQLARPSDAESSAPTSAPPPKQAERMPKTSGPVFSVSDASSGRITWKLKPTVLTTVTISSTRRASGERHAQANPSPIALITVGGLCAGIQRDELLSPHHQQPYEHGEERDRVDREADTDPEGRDQHAGEGRPDDAGGVEEAGVQRNGVRQLVAADHLERERVASRARRRRARCWRESRARRRPRPSPGRRARGRRTSPRRSSRRSESRSRACGCRSGRRRRRRRGRRP